MMSLLLAVMIDLQEIDADRVVVDVYDKVVRVERTDGSTQVFTYYEGKLVAPRRVKFITEPEVIFRSRFEGERK